jgi:type I restriction enzyme, S subunit
MTNSKSYKFSDLVNIIGGGTPKTSVAEYWNGNIPWLSVVDFGGDRKTVYTTEKRITEKGLKESSTKLSKKGQLIISARGTVGELAVLGADMAFNQSCYGLDAKPELAINNFLYYLLKYKIESLKSVAHGSVFDTITRQTFEQLEVNLPDLPTQHRIAEILSALDDKIELNRRMNQTLEQMAQTLFRQYFVDGIDEENLPEDWKNGNVSDLGKIICGKTPSKARPEFYEGEVPFIKIPDMHGETFIVSTIDSLSTKGASSQQNKYVPKGSICVSCIATVGLVSITTNPSQTNQQINTIVPRNEIYSYYSYFLMKSKEQYLKDLGSGGTATLNVNTSLFSNIKVAIPNEESLNDFHYKVEPIMLKILSNQIENIKLSKTRDTLLPKLMSGEIDVMQLKTDEQHEPILS